MTVDYSSYINSVRDPISSVMQGVQIGSGITRMKNQRAMNARINRAYDEKKEEDKAYDDDSAALIEQLDTATPEKVTEGFVKLGLKYPQYGQVIGQAYADWGARKVAKESKDRALRMNTDLITLAKKNNKTSNDFFQFAAKYPEQTDHIQKIQASYSDAKKENIKNDSIWMLTALASKDKKIVIDAMDQKIEALGPDRKAEKSGLESMRKSLLDSNTEELGQTIMALQLNALLGGGKDFTEAWDKIQARQREMERRPLDLEKLTKELEDIKSGKISSDPEKIFNVELRLRHAYDKKTAGYADMERMNNIVQGTPDDGTGDLVLITTFMKLIDSGSTVREAEVANAIKTSSWFGRIQTFFKGATTADKLGNNARERMKLESARFLKEGNKAKKKVQEDYILISKRFGLNADYYKDKVEASPGTFKGTQSIIDGEASPQTINDFIDFINKKYSK